MKPRKIQAVKVMTPTPTQRSRKVTFAATNKYIVDNSISQREYREGTYYAWGEGNAYPNVIYEQYLNSPTLQSIIDGITQYVSDGEGADLDKIAFQLELYGAFALRVGYNEQGVVYDVLDWRYLRYSTDEGKMVYSKRFGEPYSQDRTTYTYELYDPQASLYENRGRVVIGRRANFQRYPIPPIGSALHAVECETLIARYHLGAIKNGFAASAIVNFNSGGMLTDDEKAQIERDFNEKFSGADNAAVTMLVFNESKDTAATVESFSVNDFGEKYKGLADSVKQQIFTAFRINPNIFGLPTEGTGFSGEEYAQSFALFVRNVVMPMQSLIAKTLKGIGAKVMFNEVKGIGE